MINLGKARAETMAAVTSAAGKVTAVAVVALVVAIAALVVALVRTPA